MDWIKLRSYSRKSRAQKNVHCASPLPAVPASAGRMKAKAKGRTDAYVKRKIGNVIKKSLPKIREISEVTQMDCFSVEQSVELNCNENRTMEMNKNVKEMDTTPLKDSLTLNSASRKSLRNNETTSGMTLPTGISDFLLDCLDADSTVSYSTECSDDTSIYSSPEILRDERSLEESSASPQGPRLGGKNSTLLDTSKAINIDKMQQLPNLSNISGGQDWTITRPSKQKLHSGLRSASAIVAGKQVHKILPAKELASGSPSPGASLLLPNQNTQLDDQSPKKTKCKKKVKFKGMLENTSTSTVLPNSSGKSKSNAACGITVEMLVSEQPGANMEISSRAVNPGKNKALLTSTAFLQPEDLELDLSSVHKVSLSEDVLPNSCSLFVNSEEIVPSSLSPERHIQQFSHRCSPHRTYDPTARMSGPVPHVWVHSRGDRFRTHHLPPRTLPPYLCNLPEICSIVKASPEYRPLKVLQRPLNRKALFFPPGSTEDIITSSKNWVSNSDR
uniref:Meiosis-specific kinetochore protein isoform X2 n=1 Tax=Pogona vitticeps TaxID=103695 RepID=A0ABM5FLI1_9SAUR